MSVQTVDRAVHAPAKRSSSSILPRLEWDRVTAGLIAAALILIAISQPLWKMTLLAPQYPGGLHMTAYGDRFTGDVREINILNHYIGMKPIEASDVPELKLFRPGMIALALALVVLAVLPLTHWLKVAQSVAVWLVPLTIVADLQWWLYRYGHSMDPKAPLRLEPFMPKVMGDTKVMNFHNQAGFTTAFWLIVGAVAVVSIGPTLLRALWELPKTLLGTAAAALLVAVVLGTPDSAQAQAPAQRLQELITAAQPGAVLNIPAGIYAGPVTIDKPLTLDGGGKAVIDGGGAGDVVVVSGDDVEIKGFTIRNGGTAISKEPAGVRLLGHGTKLTRNRIEDVYFGIAVQGGGHHEIGFNTIRPSAKVKPEWRGHAFSLWNTEGNVIRRNEISHAKDGFFISFAHRNYIHGNRVTKSRYAIHFMNSQDNRFTENVLTDNMAGALIMSSQRVFLKGNEFSNNHGVSGHGLLIKTADDVWVEENRFTGNGTGVSIDDAPASAGTSMVFHRNLVALNQVGLALMTNTAVTFYENSFVDNLRQVSGRGSTLMGIGAALSSHEGGAATTSAHAGHTMPSGSASAQNTWTASGRGNYWSDYSGYDANGDGLGDRPYRAISLFETLRDRTRAVDLIRFTVAQQAIDAAGRMFPVVEPEVLIEDPAPLMTPPTPLPQAGNGRGLLAVSATVLLAAALPVWLLRGKRSRRRPKPVPHALPLPAHAETSSVS